MDTPECNHEVRPPEMYHDWSFPKRQRCIHCGEWLTGDSLNKARFPFIQEYRSAARYAARILGQQEE